MSGMIVKEIHIKNVMGVRELEISPSQITTISGRNGAGKTSTLEAIKNAIGGGTRLAELKNIHADDNEQPEVVLRIADEDGHEYEVVKNHRNATVRKQIGDSAAKEKLDSPQRFLDSLIDGALANPLLFLEADEKRRADLMLEAIDLPYSFSDLLERMDMKKEDLDPVPAGIHSLVEIGLHRKCLFAKRTGVNRDRKAKRSTAHEMLSSVPAETPDTSELSTLESLHAGLSERISEDKHLISAKFAEAQSDANNSCDRTVEALKAEGASVAKSIESKMMDEISELERQIEKIRADGAAQQKSHRNEIATRISEAQKERDQKIVSAYQEQNDQNSGLEKALEEKLSLENKISLLKVERERAIEIDAIKNMAKKIEAEADSLESEASWLSEAIKALDAYKAQMCEKLPVEGLSIDDGAILIDNVPWKQVNTARQMEVAVKIAALRSRKQRLKIMWVDGAERLDSANLALLKKYIAGEGVQAFVGRVSDDQLKIEKE